MDRQRRITMKANQITNERIKESRITNASFTISQDTIIQLSLIDAKKVKAWGKQLRDLYYLVEELEDHKARYLTGTMQHRDVEYDFESRSRKKEMAANVAYNLTVSMNKLARANGLPPVLPYMGEMNKTETIACLLVYVENLVGNSEYASYMRKIRRLANAS